MLYNNIYMKRGVFLLFFIFSLYRSYCGNAPIKVAENTFTVSGSGEAVFYYGFAEGDQLVFSFEEVNGMELKEIEITGMPSASIFMVYQSKKVARKIISIPRKGIYKFRFTNSALQSDCTCKFRIQRIPVNEALANFNTSVYFRKVSDTGYVTVNEKYLAASDTTVSVLTDQFTKVHSAMNTDGNRTAFNFTLPEGTIAWSYYIGADQAGVKAYEKAATGLSKQTGLLPRTFALSPLTALSLQIPSFLTHIQSDQNIVYKFYHRFQPDPRSPDKITQEIKTGDAVNDFSRMEPVKGAVFLQMQNKNSNTAVSVIVKIEALVVTQVWGTQPRQQKKIVEREEMYLQP